MAFTDIPQKAFIKGLNAAVNRFSQPKGSVPQISNLLVNPRGSLYTCDGSASIDLYNGAVTTGRGRFESEVLFSPLGVTPYYLVIAKALDMPLLVPGNVVAVDGGAGGTLAAATYYYKVTALDGIGGETTASVEASIALMFHRKVTLTWNVVPNAYGYNIYRSTSPGNEVLLSGKSVPVLQPVPLTASVTFTDDGSATTPSVAIINVVQDGTYLLGHKASVTTATAFTSIGTTVTISGNTVSDFNNTFSVLFASPPFNVTIITGAVPASGTIGLGGTLQIGGSPPPVLNTTVQVVLFKMPNNMAIPISYTNANVVATFPASPNAFGSVPSGGTGGGGGTGPGTSGAQNSTVSGGIPGLTSLIPYMTQFTNRVVMALGNGFSPQIYWDSSSGFGAAGTGNAPRAGGGTILTISVDAFGVVTITTDAPLTTTNPYVNPNTGTFITVGSNISIQGVTNTLYNGPSFVVTSVNTGASQLTVVNPAAIGQAPSTSVGSNLGFGVATTPLINTFLPAYPTWVTASVYAKGSVVAPTTPNGFYFTAVQAGVTGGSEPTWPLVVGQQVSDGSIIWVNAGTTQSGAPAPPGGGHVIVYAGSLWWWNTWPTDTSNGLDGPTSLRMSDVNNPFSYNPINQAFLDKDDGTDGMGLATFTISAEGIPPEGSLVVFKDYSAYQIIGVFGSSDFAIQRIRSDMGCTAPRSIYFVPGYGIVRYTHLGVANFGGVQDNLISEELRPYLLPENSTLSADIIPVDANWIGVSCSALTTNPPMYCLLMPIGSSGGVLTRAFCYDLVLRAWTIINFPFQISSIYQARAETTNPITVLGGFQDGQLQRWQAGDELWSNNSLVAWSVRTPEVAAQGVNDRMYLRRLFVRGTNAAMNSANFSAISMNLRINRLDLPTLNPLTRTLPAGSTGTEFQVDIGIGLVVTSADCLLSGNGRVELDSFDWMTMRKPSGIPITMG